MARQQLRWVGGAAEHESFLTAVFRRTPFLAQTPPDRLAHLATWPLAATCAAAGR